ncbi:2OG-Fe(II) oxygenase [Vibrio cincinnatiensis]|uniref:2OG-Fe(II) oxygenase n=1 Tax=Vibrio cincinnatiensis TaxID=675 RepID=UPI001EE00164|nr:2OG-Fe(II) oxygenase [Vibrio cincinnatiensis]MCG3728844.1 SM-20 protein [Vibrio cincinnatiensis]
MTLDSLLDAIAEQGWYVWEDFLTSDQVRDLKSCLPRAWQRARIGRQEEAQHVVDIRSDKIHWLYPGMGLSVQGYLERMEQIRQQVNQVFFLGLFEYEAHFAKYEAGDFYRKHLDAFRGNESRKLTTVLYLNEQWSEADGGSLALYDLNDQWVETIAPISGRLVVFLSERFPHEVLPTQAERISIAGWFRTNGVTENKLDIAH